jgi:hypothetical protein
MWDLSAASSDRLPLPNPQTELSLTPSLRVRPAVCSITKRTLYFIYEAKHEGKGSPDISFHLAVDHAATALECYRRQWSTVTDVIQHLIQVGMSFETFVARHKMFTAPVDTQICLPLGSKKHNYLFLPSDYAKYVAVRTAFLERAHARAGIQSNGIVWRLTMDVLGAEAVLRGPTPSAQVFGRMFTSTSGTQYVNDRLTEEEMDLLCGKYTIYTGSSNIFSL